MLIVVRHGQTAANAAGQLLGRADPPLTDEGRRQAAALAAALPEATLVVSSPLLRARETAECFGVPVEVDDRWTELDYGDFDERAPDQLPPGVWDRWRSDAGYRPPGGESLTDVGARVRAACDELAPAAVDGNIVVVTHVSPIKAAAAWALATGDEVAWRMYVSLASITRIGVSERGPLLRSFNEVAHLVEANGERQH